jgi:hypothetical protein
MAKRRSYKRDRRGRFAPTRSSRVKNVGRKIHRRRPRYVGGSLGKTVRVGRVGPGGEYAGIHVGAQLRSPGAGRGTTSGYRLDEKSRRRIRQEVVAGHLHALRGWGRICETLPEAPTAPEDPREALLMMAWR